MRLSDLKYSLRFDEVIILIGNAISMTPMHEFSLIYATFPSKEVALKIVRECVKAKLVACANVLGEVKSVYEWKGKLCEEEEFVAFMKTPHASAAAAIEKLKSLHPYECPCIIVLPVLGGNPEFLKWMSSNVHKSIIAIIMLSLNHSTD